MVRLLTGITMLALVGALTFLPADKPALANGYGYGYNNYGHNYGYNYGYQPYFTYYPTYYSYGYPTLPAYGYNYGYYQPSYSYAQPSYSYSQPSYNYASTNLYDGNYHYHDAGWWGGKYWPAGNYSWNGVTWVSQSGYTQAPAGWKESLIQLAKARDENREFLEALKTVGVPPPSQAPPASGVYGVPSGAKGYSNYNANLGTYGANGSTLYGYTYSTVKDLYGSSDINTLFQQAQRLAQNAQSLGGQATSDFQAAVTQEGGNRARVAEALVRATEIAAKGQAAESALRAAEGTGSRTTSSSTTFKVEPGGQAVQGQAQPQAQGAPQISPAFAQLASNKCLKCHGPDKQEAKFDVRTFPSMKPEDKVRVWERLLTLDKDRRMPKGGDPLTADEMKIFFSN